MLQFDYFYSVANSFLSIPKLLFSHPFYVGLSSEAKILYSLFLERGFETQEKLVDNNQHSYILYPMDEMKNFLNISKSQVRFALAELEKMNLIERDIQDDPSKIYVKNFASILQILEEQEKIQGETQKNNIIPFVEIGGNSYE